MWERGGATGFLWDDQTEGDFFEDPCIDGRKIFN